MERGTTIRVEPFAGLGGLAGFCGSRFRLEVWPGDLARRVRKTVRRSGNAFRAETLKLFGKTIGRICQVIE